jgi:hypothetical protein
VSKIEGLKAIRNVDAKTLEEVVRCEFCEHAKPHGKHWVDCDVIKGVMENHEFCSIGRKQP